MASLTKRPDKSYWVQYLFQRKRHTLRLGKCERGYAERVRGHIQVLVMCRRRNELLPTSTFNWLSDLDSELHNRLVKSGLVAPRDDKSLQYLLDYAAEHRTVKRSTEISYRQAGDNLISYFGSDRLLTSITAHDCEAFRSWMQSEAATDRSGTLSPVTVSKRCKTARGFFEIARRQGWIDANPFEGMKGWRDTNPARLQYVKRETIETVLQKVPDVELRLVVALARFGGLRCPSEMLPISWADIDWETGLMFIRSPKTEHHAGKDHRLVPIFAELRPYLEAAWDAAEPGQEFLLTRHRKSGQAYTSDLRRALRWAKVERWPRLWQNLRASRETELMDRFPLHVVCSWIGNSPRVAQAHYLMITQGHIAEATREAVSEAVATREAVSEADKSNTEANIASRFPR